jgi:uncharacterized protein YkwD
VLLTTVISTLNSCSSDAYEASTAEAYSKVVVNYSSSTSELETLKLIYDYRVSVGLTVLERINYISGETEGYNNYMIANNVVNHNGFVNRFENIIKTLRAKTVGEDIAYNCSSPQSAINAWLYSPGHKCNIVGNFTHFDVSIRENT